MTFKFLRDDGTFQPLASAGSSATGPITLITNTLSGNPSFSTAAFVDGPSVAQGSSGIWYASGQVSWTSANQIVAQAQLWDGTNQIGLVQALVPANEQIVTALSGAIANPAGNIRISMISLSGGITGTMFSGLGTVTAIRIG